MQQLHSENKDKRAILKEFLAEKMTPYPLGIGGIFLGYMPSSSFAPLQKWTISSSYEASFHSAFEIWQYEKQKRHKKSYNVKFNHKNYRKEILAAAKELQWTIAIKKKKEGIFILGMTLRKDKKYHIL